MESPKILKMEGCASSQPRFSIPVTTKRDPPLTENRSVQRLSNDSEWFMKTEKHYAQRLSNDSECGRLSARCIRVLLWPHGQNYNEKLNRDIENVVWNVIKI